MFLAKDAPESVTTAIKCYDVKSYKLIDTPGFGDPQED
jgi:GTP-binding protein EngB required for normal cell division